jgi:hypothetical protein
MNINNNNAAKLDFNKTKMNASRVSEDCGRTEKALPGKACRTLVQRMKEMETVRTAERLKQIHRLAQRFGEHKAPN